jgi:hypothetical protein
MTPPSCTDENNAGAGPCSCDSAVAPVHAAHGAATTNSHTATVAYSNRLITLDNIRGGDYQVNHVKPGSRYLRQVQARGIPAWAGFAVHGGRTGRWRPLCRGSPERALTEVMRGRVTALNVRGQVCPSISSSPAALRCRPSPGQAGAAGPADHCSMSPGHQALYPGACPGTREGAPDEPCLALHRGPGEQHLPG